MRRKNASTGQAFFRFNLKETREVFLSLIHIYDAPSKLICENVVPFEQTKKELWIQYKDKAAYMEDEEHLFDMLRASDGDDSVVIYCRAEKAVKRLPPGKNIYIEPGILSRLTNYFGESCVKVVEKPLESLR